MRDVQARALEVVELIEGEERPSARLPSGVSLVEREEPEGVAVVELRAADGTLVVEYLPGALPGRGSCRIHAHAVQLHADGDLSLSAGRRVQIEGAAGVELRAGESSVSIEPTHVGLVAERVETKARRLVQTVGELETNARLLFTRAKESFAEIEDLAQTKAGRLRLVAKDTLRVLGRRTVIKAREDMKLRGERIYLE